MSIGYSTLDLFKWEIYLFFFINDSCLLRRQEVWQYTWILYYSNTPNEPLSSDAIIILVVVGVIVLVIVIGAIFYSCYYCRQQQRRKQLLFHLSMSSQPMRIGHCRTFTSTDPPSAYRQRTDNNNNSINLHLNESTNRST